MDISSIFINPFFWLKMMALLITAAYCIFALVITNQIRTMDKIIHLPPTKIILSVSVFNLFLGAFLFLLALVIL